MRSAIEIKDLRERVTTHRPNVIALFKSKRRWCHHVVTKLSLTQDLTVVYALPIIKKSGFSGLVEDLNQAIEHGQVDRVFLFVDFFYGLDREFVRRINSRVRKILVTFDDITLHDFNLQTALACDLVLTADPISVLKYQEAGLDAGLLMLESSGRRYCEQKAAVKTTEVLFFGNDQLADRAQYLDFLERHGIAVRRIGGADRYIDSDELVQEICRAKIIVNFSKSDVLDGQTHFRDGLPFLLQLKGRIIEAGLCGVLCISEDAPALRLLFSEDELPVFRSHEECLKLIREFLYDDEKRSRTAMALHEKCLLKFEDEVLMENVELLLSQRGRREIEEGDRLANKVPFRYRKRVVRARIEVIWGRPREMLCELGNVLWESSGLSTSQRILLGVDTICWIIYRSLRRLA